MNFDELAPLVSKLRDKVLKARNAGSWEPEQKLRHVEDAVGILNQLVEKAAEKVADFRVENLLPFDMTHECVKCGNLDQEQTAIKYQPMGDYLVVSCQICGFKSETFPLNRDKKE